MQESVLPGALPPGQSGAASARRPHRGRSRAAALGLLACVVAAAGTGGARAAGGSDATTPMALAIAATGADEAWKDGFTGAGIDVALIDSGVAPVLGLAAPGQLVNGPDLSFDLQAGAPAHADGFGHGTHLAGIIAGRDPGVDLRDGPENGEFTGIAPGARIVSVKVAGADGQVDVSQVIAAIDWVVQYRRTNGLDIRVLTLAFGSDGTQDYRIDPLARAVENAWEHGIVVVVAAGNTGATRMGLTNPALDPFVLAVGASDPGGTGRIGDDTVPAWSGRGDGIRNPDVVAPGVAIRSLRVPGSTLDAAYPATAGSPRIISGSGSSQAAAVVAGAVALLLDAQPGLTPDQVKAHLRATARPIAGATPETAGAGLVDIERAIDNPAPAAVQAWPASTGTGSLDAARGASRVALGGTDLAGEQDVFGMPWNGQAWADSSRSTVSWDGGTWNGSIWAGACWCGMSAAGLSWSGLSWTGLSWSGLSWSGLSWSGLSWSGLSWSGLGWDTSAHDGATTNSGPSTSGDHDPSWSTEDWGSG